MLRLGGAEVAISYLELLDDNVGPRGAHYLGASLSQNNNLSLLTLKLDFNSTLGLEGMGTHRSILGSKSFSGCKPKFQNGNNLFHTQL